MDFLNRREERQRLDSLLQAKEGKMAVLWGRRRMGKSRLLREWCAARQGLYFVADEDGEQVQRELVAKALEARLPGFGEVTYADWRTLFSRLLTAREVARWRGPLVLDEFPYLVHASPELPSILQHWVDGPAREAGVKLVLCGSTQRMMQGLILDESAPLYGRAQELMKLGPLLPGYIHQAFPGLDDLQALRYFLVWGGCPRYWELATSVGKSLDATLEHLVLDPSGVLHEEPKRWFLEEGATAPLLRSCLETIGSGERTLGGISSRLGTKATSLSTPLAQLRELGLVERELPFGASERDSKRSLYGFTDEFFRFWYTLVAPRRSALAMLPPKGRIALWKNHGGEVYATSFEAFCRRFVPRLEKLSPIADHGPWNPARRYWYRSEPEIDLLSESLDGEWVLMGEVKWFERPSVKAIRASALTLLRKVPPAPVRDKKILRVLFLPQRPEGMREIEGVHLVSGAEMLRELV